VRDSQIGPTKFNFVVVAKYIVLKENQRNTDAILSCMYMEGEAWAVFVISGGARACSTRMHTGATATSGKKIFRDAHEVKFCFCIKKSVFNLCPGSKG
jgi:hypothetical protein